MMQADAENVVSFSINEQLSSNSSVSGMFSEDSMRVGGAGALQFNSGFQRESMTSLKTKTKT